MKKDIKTRLDIEQLIKRFIERVKADELLAPVFDHIHMNWEKNLPVMFDFWENTLFYTGAYTGNPMQAHKNIHNSFPLEEKHFQRWVYIFNSTVDEFFEGEKALLAKQRAISISSAIRRNLLSPASGPEKINFNN